MPSPEEGTARGPLRGFLLASLVWLPTAFLAWYWLAPVIQVGAWLVAEAVRAVFLGDLVAGIEVHGRAFEVVTRVRAEASSARAVMSFAIDPLVYSCGMPLFAGLTLASRGAFGAVLARLGIGLAALVPVQAFGVVLAILKALAFDLGNPAGWGGAAREAIALGFQLGSLVLPTVLALVAWAALNRQFVAELVGRGPAAEGEGGQ